MILIPIFSHKRGLIERNHIKPTIHPPSWWSAWTFSTFKGMCTKYTENCVKRDWHWRKQTLFYLLLYFLCRFETKYESNIHRYQDTSLRAFTIVAILGRRLLSTYTTVSQKSPFRSRFLERQSSKPGAVGSSPAVGKNFSFCNSYFHCVADISSQPIWIKSTVTYT